MKKFRLFLLCLTMNMTVLSSFTHAEDIDIYSDNAATLGLPNLMFVIDNASRNSANFGTCVYVDGGAPSLGATSLGNQQCALVNIVSTLPKQTNGTSLINLGIATSAGIVFKLTPIDDNAYTGSYPVPARSTNRQAFILAAKALTKNTGSVVQGDSMQETWAYYTGGNGGNTGSGLLSGATYPGTNATSGCQKNFAMFIGSADTSSAAGDNGNGDNSKTALFTSIDNVSSFTAAQKTALKTGITNGALPNKYTSDSNAREWARFMYRYDANNSSPGVQSIVTYSLSLGGTNVDMKNFIKDMATFGGGKGFNAGVYVEVVDAILKVLNEVQAVNSAFASASLPVSVNAQGTFLNQIFLGLFRPEASANPRWIGNLKQYQFILEYPDPANPDPNKAILKLGDSAGNPAISSSGTGFISPNAVSYWSKKDVSTAPDSSGGFFINDARGAGLAFDSPDGELVEKGGAAQQLRLSNLTVNYAATPSSPRRLYTYCPIGVCIADLSNPANAFASTNLSITTALLNVGITNPTRLINWVRGEDNLIGDEASPGSGYNVRPSIHGDVLHSRPVAINFGTDAAPRVVVFYGGNDGVFRAINGNQSSAIALPGGAGTVAPGGELWGLVFPEHFGRLNRQRVNSPELKLPSTTLAGALPKDYFVDGSSGVYQKLKADGTVDKAYLYLTMRRGGRFIYALDVSDPTAPKIMWKKSFTDSGFAEMGQTWSRPRVTIVKGYANPVLVFGAGYDPAEDAEPPTAGVMGRGIYILDAVTGNRVWSAAYSAGATTCTGNNVQAACAVSGMNWAIPADVTFVDRDNDGKTDRLYAADLGGNIWRIDLEQTAGNTPDKWRVNKLAALGCDLGVCTSGTTPRKFFFPPNVVPVGATGGSASYDTVLLGSGDREHPLNNAAAGSAYNVLNRFYALKDTTTGMDSTGVAAITEAGLFNSSTTAYDGTLKGFYTTFATGEKAVNASITLRGTTFFGTNRPIQPSANSCASNLGQARGYALDPFKGTFNFTVYDGGGLPPSPTAGIVTISLPGGKSVKKEFCIGCGGSNISSPPCTSALEACTPNQKVAPNLRRTYWYKKNQ